MSNLLYPSFQSAVNFPLAVTSSEFGSSPVHLRLIHNMSKCNDYNIKLHGDVQAAFNFNILGYNFLFYHLVQVHFGAHNDAKLQDDYYSPFKYSELLTQRQYTCNDSKSL